MTGDFRTELAPGSVAGERLDKALAAFLPGAGLRLRRRLVEDGRVLVDGEPRRPGYRLRGGETLRIPCLDSTPQIPPGVRVLAVDERFAAVYKPEGAHSAAIAGRDEPSVEASLALLFPDAEPEKAPVLVNRLDQPTSGILIAAFGEDAAREYRELEAAGLARKTYRARVEGDVPASLILRGALDADDRKRTRVLDVDASDPSRWTEVRALSHDQGSDVSEVLAVIRRGARHQIRAHLARAGHPIVGDARYGGREAQRLHLHHERIELPGFAAEIEAPWLSESGG